MGGWEDGRMGGWEDGRVILFEQLVRPEGCVEGLSGGFGSGSGCRGCCGLLSFLTWSVLVCAGTSRG
jgi:hypothetical protein